MSIFIQMQRYPLLVTVEQAHLAVQLQDPHLHKEVDQSLHGSDLFTKLIYYVILVVVCICIEHDCYVLTSYFAYEYTLGHCGLSAASRHKFASTSRHYSLLTPRHDRTLLNSFLCFFFKSI